MDVYGVVLEVRSACCIGGGFLKKSTKRGTVLLHLLGAAVNLIGCAIDASF